MIIDCREWDRLPSAVVETQRRRVFVDGTEIRYVFYVDTEKGLVHTYDVHADDDGYCRKSRGLEVYDDAWETESGVMASTVYGRVDLRPI